MEASLYIHIPFCARKCAYCDFYSRAVEQSAPEIDRYLAWLYEEIVRQLEGFHITRVPTVYIGGGSPSFIGARRLEALFKFLAAVLPGKPDEMTIEVNPESVDDDLLAACAAGGIQRLSAGIQTFNGASRAALGRPGGASELHARLRPLAAGGFDISFDLMTALPYQNDAVLAADIESALIYHPVHISLYDLCVEAGTPLADPSYQHRDALHSPEDAASLWIKGRDMLEKAGYHQYEVSNFALPGKESRHNTRYWRMYNWLGVGTTASGTLIDDNTGSGVRYADGAEEMLSRTTLIQETLMMGFRTLEGPDAELFMQRFQTDITDVIPQTLAAWRKQGLLSATKTALTRNGLLVLNKFLADCFTELDASLMLQ
ncbi:MAG: coproporphyrinogen III oxidase family protein [Spirochaetaceae bacterium]|jgi:oxygen-independent coproporphyrinogen-3 oxidase|nr:coproporphyrinogen III oxidase family protein [Spirochaetaceae bacterium]